MTLQRLVLGVTGVRVAAAAAILLAILQILDLLDVTTDILDRGLGMSGVAYYAALRLPRLIEQVAPLSVLAGGLFAFAQLARESAVIAMRAAGVSVYRLIAMAAPVAAVVMVVDIGATEFVAPRTDPVLEAWWRDTAPAADRNELKARPFRVGGDLVVAKSDDVRGRRLLAVQIYRRNPEGRLVEVIESPLASYGGGRWTLEKPSIVRIADGQAETSTASEMDWSVPLTPADVQGLFGAEQSPTAASAQRALHGGGSERPDSFYAVRIQKALAGPVSLFVMLLLTAPVALGNFRTREGTILSACGLGAGLAFMVADGLLLALGEAAALSPFLAAWTAPLVFAALATTVLLRMEG